MNAVRVETYLSGEAQHTFELKQIMSLALEIRSDIRLLTAQEMTEHY